MFDPGFFDTHCHLDYFQRNGILSQTLVRASSAGVSRCIIPGVTPDEWPLIAELANNHKSVFPAFGIHPLHVHLYSDDVMNYLEDFFPNAVAIGEIGLDYLADLPDKTAQQTAFRRQLRMAVTAGLPVIIHCRKAFGDLLTILGEEHVERVGGVMHAFSGSRETAEICIKLGLSIGVAGTVTYSNAVRPVEVVRSIPLEYLLLETDSPDIAPEPYRGRDNEPAYILETARTVARIKGVDLSVVETITTSNALRLFSLEKF